MKQIGMKGNPHFPGIEIKLGENQYSRHSHIHRAWSFSYVLHGKTVVSIGTWQSELTEDQFIAVPPGIPHLCSPDRENPFSFAVLYLPVDYINIPSPEFTQPKMGKIDSEILFPLFDLFIQAKSREELKGHSENLNEILGKTSSPLDGDWGMNLLKKESAHALKHLRGSRFQLYRYTRKLFGIGQKKISTIEKMEQAKELMTEGVDLAEVALRCGFYDQSHFCKVFKLYTGLSPSQYMKR